MLGIIIKFLQLRIADKLLQGLGIDNLVTAGLGWGCDITAKLTSSMRVPGFRRLRISDREELDEVNNTTDTIVVMSMKKPEIIIDMNIALKTINQELRLPMVGLDSFWELLLGTTGPFVIKKAMGILTSARCCELDPLRRAGLLGTLQEYHELCQALPQVWM